MEKETDQLKQDKAGIENLYHSERNNFKTATLKRQEAEQQAQQLDIQFNSGQKEHLLLKTKFQALEKEKKDLDSYIQKVISLKPQQLAQYTKRNAAEPDASPDVEMP